MCLNTLYDDNGYQIIPAQWIIYVYTHYIYCMKLQDMD